MTKMKYQRKNELYVNYILIFFSEFFWVLWMKNMGINKHAQLSVIVWFY